MIKHKKQLPFLFFVVLFSLVSLSGHAQSQAIPKADNTIHDRMYLLLQKSNAVVLPTEITEHINLINKDNPYKAKVVYAQLSVLKVLYNKALPKEDIRFFGNQLLKTESEIYSPISGDIKTILGKL